MKKIILIITIVALSVVGYFIYANMKEVGFLRVGYVPSQIKDITEGTPYVQLIRLKGHTASTLMGEKIQGKYEMTDDKIVIHFPKEDMTLKREGGIYKDIKTNIEYSFQKE